MASNLVAVATTLVVMAPNLIAMASNLLAMASYRVSPFLKYSCEEKCVQSKVEPKVVARASCMAVDGYWLQHIV